MRYKFSRKAREDFLAVHRESVRLFGLMQAERYADDLFRTFDFLAANPRAARQRFEINPPVRIHPHASHLIVYIEAESGILILRIRHGRENWAENPA